MCEWIRTKYVLYQKKKKTCFSMCGLHSPPRLFQHAYFAWLLRKSDIDTTSGNNCCNFLWFPFDRDSAIRQLAWRLSTIVFNLTIRMVARKDPRLPPVFSYDYARMEASSIGCLIEATAAARRSRRPSRSPPSLPSDLVHELSSRIQFKNGMDLFSEGGQTDSG